MLKVVDGILDGADDGDFALRADGNLPCDVLNVVLAHRAPEQVVVRKSWRSRLS